MGQAGTADDITKLIDEQAGKEDALSVELARGRYPSMLVEEEEVGWPSKVGEGTRNGWYGSDPALTSPEDIEEDTTPLSPSRMRQHMRRLEAETAGGAATDVEEIPTISTDLRQRRKRAAAQEAKALTRYVVGKHRLNGSFGLGATPFGAQWAVQNALNDITTRENKLMAISPERLESIRRLNATTYSQIEESRKILEGPSVAITDELAAVTKFTLAAASYKSALDSALKAVQPAKPKVPKARVAPLAVPRARPSVLDTLKKTLTSPLGIAGIAAASLGVGLLAYLAIRRR